MGGMEKLSFNKCLLANNEVWGCRSASVCGSLISALGFCYINFKLFVEFVEVNDKVFGMGGGEVSFRMDRKVRVVAFVSEERRYSCSSTGGVVVCKLG